jgi:hypothetical protein
MRIALPPLTEPLAFPSQPAEAYGSGWRRGVRTRNVDPVNVIQVTLWRPTSAG